MANRWIEHVKKTRANMRNGVSLKEVLIAAKKTYRSAVSTTTTHSNTHKKGKAHGKSRKTRGRSRKTRGRSRRKAHGKKKRKTRGR